MREEDAKVWEEEDESDSGYGKESAPQRDSGYIEDQFPSTARSDGDDGWEEEDSDTEENPFDLACVVTSGDPMGKIVYNDKD